MKGQGDKGNFPSSPQLLISSLLLVGKGHLPSIVTQERNDGGEENDEDEIDGMRYLGLHTTPQEKDDFENEKKDRKLNLSFYKIGELRSVINPPCEEPGGHGKGRGDGAQNEEVEAGGLERRILEDGGEKDKKGGDHQKGNRKVDDHGVWMASCHWELLKEGLKHGGKMFQFFGRSFFQNPHLGISFKNLCSMRSRGDFSRQVLTRGMPVHVKALGPERAFRDIKDLPLKGDIDRSTVLSVKRCQFHSGELFHFFTCAYFGLRKLYFTFSDEYKPFHLDRNVSCPAKVG
jgi:hypothetical protein